MQRNTSKGNMVVSSGSTATHLVFLGTEDKLYTLGYSVVHEIGNVVPTKLDFNYSGRIVQVAAGRYHSLILSDEGSVFGLGDGFKGQLCKLKSASSPEFLDLSPLDAIFVVYVACGDDFSYIVTSGGDVFSFGCNRFGQLGIDSEADKNEPTRILLPIDHRAKKISCGYAHAAVITETGVLFLSGANEYGQLGTGDKSKRKIPFKIDIEVVDVACGMYFTVILARDGRVLTCGDNHSGQLGHGDTESISNFRSVKVFEDINASVKEISCGFAHCLCRVEQEGVFSFGNNDYGQLCRNSENNDVPMRVKHLSGNVTGILSSAEESFFIIENKELVGIGRNETGILGNGTRDVQALPTTVYSQPNYTQRNRTGDNSQRGSDGVYYPMFTFAGGPSSSIENVVESTPTREQPYTINVAEIISEARIAQSDLENALWKFSSENATLRMQIQYMEITMKLLGNQLDVERRLREVAEEEVEKLNNKLLRQGKEET